MRSPLVAGLGVLFVIIGGLWVGQGSGAVGGSAMSGQTQWLLIGLVVALVGLAMIFYGIRARHRPPPPPPTD